VKEMHPTEVSPVLPSLLVHGEPQVFMGRGSGMDSVGHWLAAAGVAATPAQVTAINSAVSAPQRGFSALKELSMPQKGLLTEREFKQLALQVISTAREAV
jgi:hypothetical protein